MAAKPVQSKWKSLVISPKSGLIWFPCRSTLERHGIRVTMDVDSASSSPSERLSVVCSASAEYSSNSSEYSPNSRRYARVIYFILFFTIFSNVNLTFKCCSRNSVNENVMKDEHYWERRRKNNDASKRSREKRRISDIAMEQRILALSQENQLLKSRLESRTAAESLLGQRSVPDYPAMPSQSNTVLQATPAKSIFSQQLPTSSLGLPPLPAPTLTPIHAPVSSLSLSSVPMLPSASQLPIMQFCQLQAAIQQQV
uniref:BZIP domain-containing protein n=1 Tax=Heterorhabditis bacteriophora TaxID=37862 RepID=A0A1I7WXC3_HETBA